jgi:hypothetical protein
VRGGRVADGRWEGSVERKYLIELHRVLTKCFDEEELCSYHPRNWNGS